MSAIGKLIGTSLLTLTLGSSIAFGAVAGADLNKLKLENQTLTETNTTITEENTNLKTSLAEYIAEQKTLQDNLTTCQTALDLANTNLANLEAELELSEAEVLSLTNHKTELENNIASLNSQITTLTNEKEQLTNDLATANENLQTKENELLAVNSSLVEKQTELEAKKTELANLQLQYENLGKENSTLKTNIESLTNEVTTLEGEVITLNNEKTSLENQITTLTNEKSNLETRVLELEDAIGMAEAAAGTAQSQLAEAEYNLGVVTEERDSLLTEKQTLQNQISALQTTISENEATITQLNARIEELENSSSSSGTVTNVEEFIGDLNVSNIELENQIVVKKLLHRISTSPEQIDEEIANLPWMDFAFPDLMIDSKLSDNIYHGIVAFADATGSESYVATLEYVGQVVDIDGSKSYLYVETITDKTFMDFNVNSNLSYLVGQKYYLGSFTAGSFYDTRCIKNAVVNGVKTVTFETFYKFDYDIPGYEDAPEGFDRTTIIMEDLGTEIKVTIKSPTSFTGTSITYTENSFTVSKY